MKKKVKALMIGSYFLVFIVCMLIYLVVQYETEKRIRDVYIERQIVVMNQAVMGIDRELEMVKKFCLKLSQDPYVQLFSFKKPQLDKYDMEDIVKLVRNIRQNYTGEPLIEDIYIYYEASGRIANSNSFYKAEDYYRQEWNYQDKDLNQWLDMLEKKEYSGYLPALVMKNNAKQGNYITYIHKFGSSRSGETSAIVVLLKKDRLDELLKGISENGRTIIKPDGQENVEFYFGESNGIGNVDLEGQWTEGDGDWKKSSINKVQYLATRIRSERTGWLYESLIPYEIITEQMKKSTRPLLIGVIIYGLIGIPVCLLLALKSYEPIKKLTGHMEKLDGGKDRKYSSEFDYLYSGIEKIHRKYEELEIKYGSTLQEYDAAAAKLKRNRERIQEGILQQLIGGHWKDERELPERLASMDIEFPYPKFCVIIIQIETFPSLGQQVLDVQERALILFILKNVSQELLEPVGKIYPISGEIDKLCILTNLAECGYEDMQTSTLLADLLRQLRDYMLKSMQIPISVGAGTVCSEIDELGNSYKMAKRALDYCFILGKSSVIIYDKMDRERRKKYHFDEKLEKNIINAVAQRNPQLCCRFLDDAYNGALMQNITVNEGKQFHIFMTELAIQAISKFCVNRLMEASYQDMVEEMLNCETLPEVLPFMKEVLTRLCFEPEKEDENVLGKNVVQFIQNNYWRADFSLQMCADEFRVTPEHLSRSIKVENGRNFMEIVNSFRIDKAKYYLSQTNKKMEEIAELTGYGTAKSFFRSFKQLEGITPGEWRKKAHAKSDVNVTK